MAAAAVALTTACVHEYPEGGQEVDPTEISLTVQLSTDPSVTEASVFSKDGDDAGMVCFVVELYQDEYEGEPLMRCEETVAKDASGVASVSFDTLLHAGHYRLAAFAASVPDAGTGSIYDMSDLSNISFAESEYVGSTDLKECYDIRMDIDLSADEWYAQETVSGVMTSPAGRVEIISEDAGEFLSRLPKPSPAASAEDADFWQNYSVRWSYALYFPVGYNVFTGYPNRSETGISFESDLSYLSSNEVLMGFDYVFVNGEETAVDITLDVYDKTTGELLNTYSGLEANIYKGQTTVIRGDFLTTSQGSGVGIDPGFDGDIDIFLED